MVRKQGHPTGNFEKKTLEQQQSMNISFLKPFYAFWEIAGKNLSVPHSQQD